VRVYFECCRIELNRQSGKSFIFSFSSKWQAYTQRWFLALGVNVLPYTHLMDLVDAFLSQGAVVLHRLGLAIVKQKRIFFFADFLIFLRNFSTDSSVQNENLVMQGCMFDTL